MQKKSSYSVSILKDRLIDMRNVYDHVFSSKRAKEKPNENNEVSEWLLEIKQRMMDIELEIEILENK